MASHSSVGTRPATSVAAAAAEEVLARPTYIDLTVWTQHAEEFYAKVNPNSKLQKLMAAHASRFPLDGLDTYEYLRDGKIIRGSQTAADLQLKNGDQIDAMVRMRGGSGPVLME